MKRRVRQESVLFKVTAEEKRALENAAIKADMSVSAYLRRLLFGDGMKGGENNE